MLSALKKTYQLYTVSSFCLISKCEQEEYKSEEENCEEQEKENCEEQEEYKAGTYKMLTKNEAGTLIWKKNIFGGVKPSRIHSLYKVVEEELKKYKKKGTQNYRRKKTEEMTEEFVKKAKADAKAHGARVEAEEAPKKIKMAVTGNGNASKEQVALMLKSLLNLKTLPKNLDATDGLAAAVCHFYNSGKVVGGKNYTGWASFVKDNPSKIK